MSVRMQNRLVRQALDDLLDGPDRFKHWLATQPLNLHFVSGKVCGCPLWVYLNDSLSRRGHSFEYLRVTVEQVEYQVTGAGCKQYEWLPNWATRFSRLDQIMGEQGICEINRIQALAMLAKV